MIVEANKQGKYEENDWSLLIGEAHYRCSRHSIRSDSLNAMARSILPVESKKRTCQIVKTRQ
jgi:hypothetical protein